MWISKTSYLLAIASVTDDLSALKTKISDIAGIAIAAREQAQEGESLTIVSKALAVQTAELEKRLADVELSLTRLDAFKAEIKVAVAEGIERVDRADRRIKDTVRRARKQFAELGHVDSGLEAEAEGLSLVGGGADGGDGEGTGMPAVRTEVVEAQPTPSSIKGVSAETLFRVRGM